MLQNKTFRLCTQSSYCICFRFCLKKTSSVNAVIEKLDFGMFIFKDSNSNPSYPQLEEQALYTYKEKRIIKYS